MVPMKTIRVFCAVTAFFLLCALVSGCAPSRQDSMYQKTVDGVTIYRGTQTRRYTVSGGQPQALTVRIERRSGSLDIRVRHVDSGEYVYRGSDLPTSAFTIGMAAAGEYILTVTADDFCGSFQISTDAAS